MQDPLFVPQLMAHVGPAALADWMLHVGGLAAFSTFNSAGAGQDGDRHTYFADCAPGLLLTVPCVLLSVVPSLAAAQGPVREQGAARQGAVRSQAGAGRVEVRQWGGLQAVTRTVCDCIIVYGCLVLFC